MNLAELYKRNPLEACRCTLRQTRSLPENDRLEAINELLGTHGTEAIRGDWQNGYWCDIVAAYCNAGDTYALTVIQVRGDTRSDRSRFVISSWGDFVVANDRKYNFA